MAQFMSIFTQCLIKMIQLYRLTIRSFLGQRCRFEPSCSAYAIEALHIHGFFRGAYLIIRRLMCCHPWHHGGFDPVP